MDLDSVQSIELTTFAGASITDVYQPMNGNGLSDDVKILLVINDSAETIMISFDGVKDTDVIFSGSSKEYEFQANAANTPTSPGIKYVRKGQIIYAKKIAGLDIYIGGYR